MTPPQAVGGDTAYTIGGAGPPVVLVHGMGLNSHMWDWQMDPSAISVHLVPFLEETLLG